MFRIAIICFLLLRCTFIYDKEVILIDSEEINLRDQPIISIHDGNNFRISKDFFSQFNCRQNSVNNSRGNYLIISKYEIVYFIRYCVIQKAFNGETKCNIFMQQYLEKIDSNEFELKNSHFRGIKIFEILLDMSFSDECITPSVCIGESAPAQNTLYALKEMIKSIDNMSLEHYLDKNYRFEELESKHCSSVQIVRMILLPIKDAWFDGQIRLKDFGEL